MPFSTVKQPFVFGKLYMDKIAKRRYNKHDYTNLPRTGKSGYIKEAKHLTTATIRKL